MKSIKIKIFSLFIILLLTAMITVAQTTSAPTDREKQKIDKVENGSQKSLRELEIELDIKRLELEIERHKNLSVKPKSVNQDSTTSDTKVPIKKDIFSETKQFEVKLEEKLKAAKTEVPPPVQANDKCAQVVLNRTKSSEFDRNLCDAVDLVVADGELNLTGVSKELTVLYLYSAQKNEVIKDIILGFEKKRTDKQVGNDAKGSGTTSLVVKGSTPQVIGWAVENGAATSSISGTTVTIRANPLGFINTLAGQGFVGDFDRKLSNQDDYFTRALKKASVGFSFDTMRGVETPTFLANQRQLSAVSFRYELINHRNPLRSVYKDKWNDFFTSQIKTLTSQLDNVDALVDINTETYKNKVLQDWLEATNVKIRAIPRNPDGSVNRIAIRESIEERLKELSIDEILRDSTVKDALINFGKAGTAYSTARETFIETLNKGTIVTFEYTNNREPIAPDTHNFRFIAEKGDTVRFRCNGFDF